MSRRRRGPGASGGGRGRAPRPAAAAGPAPGARSRRWTWLALLLAVIATGALLLAARLARSRARAPGAAASLSPDVGAADRAPDYGAGTRSTGGAPPSSGRSGGPASPGTLPTGGAPLSSDRSGAPASAPGLAPGAAAPAGAVERLRVEVLSVRPHDPTAYTQGLVWDQGTLYESAGLYGSSSLRQVDPRTGEVLRRLDVPPGFFAEGLAAVGDRLIQLTWKEGVAFVYDRRKLERTSEYHYQGEGWGLCDDGRRLVMSDGSDRLTFRDRRTFEAIGGVDVRLDGRPARQLNELECVAGAVYANVWMTDQILRIDPATGRVTAVIDAGGLLGAAERAGADVLNGIAYDPVGKTFLITGKLWPKLFEVRFVPAAAPSGPRR